MTDILERIEYEIVHGMDSDLIPLLEESRDEITRLREEVKSYKEAISGYSSTMIKAADVITRLRKEMERKDRLIKIAYEEVKVYEDYNNALSHMMEALQEPK